VSGRPVTVVTSRARTMARAMRILGSIVKVGVRLVPSLARCLVDGDRQRLAAAAGRIISQQMWILGPAFVKIGQMMATRQDVLPPALCRELRLSLAFGHGGGRDRPRQHAQVVTEIGSVAQVTRSVVDDTAVAVKRIHPGAARALENDVAVVRALCRIAGRVLPTAERPLTQVTEEVCRSVQRQTDLVTEARTLERLGVLADTLPVVVPRVLPGHSDSSRLVMTWVDGQDHSGRRQPGPRAAKRLVLAVYEMLFVTGVVHCDLHPGNWWELPDGRIAMVDAGFSYEIDDEMREHFAEFFLGMSSANAEVCATHALAVCAVPVSPAQETAFRTDMDRLIRANTGLTAGHFSLARFAADFFRIQRRHNAWSRATFIYPFMALLAIEGQVKQLDPGLNFQSLAGPVVLRALVNRARSGSSDRTAQGPFGRPVPASPRRVIR